MKTEPRDSMKDYGDLLKLADSDGWKLILAEYGGRFDKLTDLILDAKTPAQEAENLRQARAALVRDFAPDLILKNLIAKTVPRAKEQTNSVGKESSLH